MRDQLVFRFEHETPQGKQNVQIRIPRKFMAEQYLFDFANKDLTKKNKIYNNVS